MDDKDKQKVSQVQNIQEPSHVKTLSKPIRKSRIGKGMLTFLAGILVGILLMGLYTIAVEEYKNPNNQVGVPTSSQAGLYGSSSDQNKERITEDELKNYEDVKDCSSLSNYSEYAISLNRLPMKTISLDENMITAGRDGGTNYIRWRSLPVVVDYQCNEIKLTDIKAGDLLNIYTVRATDPNMDYSTDTRIIQKANK